VALVDPGDDRHQLHRRNVAAALEVFAMIGGVGERRHGAALRLGHIGMELGEAAHVDFVDQAAVFEPTGAA
jgi:hypothetical protein